MEYLKTTDDDSPLYIFDSGYGDHPRRKKLLEDYELPLYFRNSFIFYSSVLIIHQFTCLLKNLFISLLGYLNINYQFTWLFKH